MEAAVAEKEGAKMTEGNDRRLDELSNSVGYLTGRVDEMTKRMDEGFARVNVDIRQLSGRFDALQQTLVRISLTIAVGLLSIFAALVANHL